MPWFDDASISLHYRLSGKGSRTLILVHELGGSLDSWDGVCERLEQDFLVLRWDQRGVGLSEKIVANSPLDQHADDLNRLIAFLGLKPPFFLSGVAAGAAIALIFAGLQPESAVAGAVYCAPALGVAHDRRHYLLERSAQATASGMRAVVEPSLQRSYPEPFRDEDKTFDVYRARFLSNDPVSYGLANMALADFQIGDRLEKITYPVVLLAGVHDVLRPPSEVAPLAERIPGAAFAVIDSGHIMQVQAPETVAAAILALAGKAASQA